MRPFFSAERAYSNSSISLVFATLRVEIAEVPALEVGELVVRRQERMRLAVALGLRGLVEPLPSCPLLGILPVDRLAEGLDDGEHQAVAQIAVVRDGQHAAAGLLLVGLPSTSRARAGLSLPERRIHGERLDLARLVAVVAEDDVAVQVVAAGVARSTRSR